MDPIELTVVMPCLNEAETLAVCIDKAHKCLSRMGVRGEILIADNGSTDGSQEIARAHGARVVDVPVRGYGAALQTGIESAAGTYVIMGDADDSYDFENLDPFLERLRAGDDLVMGNRFRGGIAPGAMPRLHRYLGNPVLSFVGRLFFRSPIKDFHCGLRGFRRDSILALDLRTTGMEFASEMVVRATLAKLTLSEVPTTLSPDGRTRAPHLRSWHDGWRHLRFLLLYSPRWLFLYPGIFLVIVGLIGMTALIPGSIHLGHTGFDIQSLLYASGAVLLGCQILLFAFLGRIFAVREGLLPRDERVHSLHERINLEKGIFFGGLLALAGLVGVVSALLVWGSSDFGALEARNSLRLAIPSMTALILGAEAVFGSFLISLLGVPHR